MNWTGNLREKARFLADLAMPDSCRGCGTPLLFNRAADYPLCGDCLAGLRPISGRRCPVCSIDLLSEEGTCTRCRSRNYIFKRNVSVFPYSGMIRELIFQYKFKKTASLSVFFADFLHQTLVREFPGMPVVPVPARSAPFFRQRFPHIRRMAMALKKRQNIDVQDLLRRLPGKQLKKLGIEERTRSIHGKIRIKGDSRILPASLVLLDDIFTTGATVNECARVLVEHGAAAVYVLTVALDY